ncbi:hypothetical protein A6302_04523 [Methylobrevis pamukkalensis]|uniref:Uncharacterized protein n=1 Tax=Methylobrevis pamukkalensis TaxID=1439726 RepID=A0A1E3GN90_9HYPH|nr:hypothetical protein A6302_04523 [Methylobrevis pamukkalensis]
MVPTLTLTPKGMTATLVRPAVPAGEAARLVSIVVAAVFSSLSLLLLFIEPVLSSTMAIST